MKKSELLRILSPMDDSSEIYIYASISNNLHEIIDIQELSMKEIGYNIKEDEGSDKKVFFII